MNRHLNNSLTALVASATLLVAGLMAATPNASQGATHESVAVANAANGQFGLAGVDASDAVRTTVLATALEQAALTLTTESPRATRTSPRKRRQALVMPYLSFAPRG